MEVTSTSTVTTSSTTTTAAASATVDYDAFLRLLTAQLQNQDPTNPADSTEYMAQLASFSNVEQAIQTNQKLDALLASQGLAQADGVIGRTVVSADGLTSGTVAAVRITDTGLLAILEDGTTLELGEGVTIA